MSDEFGSLFDEPADAGGTSVELVVEPARQIADALGRLDFSAASGSSLPARGKLVELHAQLHRIERLVHDRRIALERSFVAAAAEANANELRTSVGIVKIKLPDAQYETRAQAIREGLTRLVAEGTLSKEEVDAACPVTITYGVNHTKLNALHRHRGDAVREVIDSNRHRIEPDPLAARPMFPKVKEDAHVKG